MSAGMGNHHYNPDWMSDDALVANFVARQSEFTFLRDELAHAPRQGSVQHYLLIGLRGAGKTTLLKRLAIAIRRDADLQDHLLALSFPEELYQVKHLADFWWVSCDALADELDRLGKGQQADALLAAVDAAGRRGGGSEPLSDAGLKLLLATCAELGKRPVLLVDNLDLVFARIDKNGRKRNDPNSPAYWALREALSTQTAPIVIGGSARLTDSFTDYDRAFYDFFLPKRLNKLPLPEVRRVLERLADAQALPEVKVRLHQRPSRIDALYELTGGNPRALGLIFELLRQGPNSRAVEDFERLMDITTPYYKARFEELAEQAQVVMHALAVRRPGDGTGLRFGHTAAEIANHAGLPTNVVSAQMDVLEREGLVEKTAAHGRTQYRIAEQLFRLWLQMRGNRRIRQNVIGLAEFLQAMFDVDELQAGAQEACCAGALAEAKYAFAAADSGCGAAQRRGLEARGADQLLQYMREQGGEISEYLAREDLSEDLSALVSMREQLRRCGGGGLSEAEQDALLGAVTMRDEQKKTSVAALCQAVSAAAEAALVRSGQAVERGKLLRYGLLAEDLPLLYSVRARGCLPLPNLTPADVDAAFMLKGVDAGQCRAMVWRLLGSRHFVRIVEDEVAEAWLAWGKGFASEASADSWANVCATLRLSQRLAPARQALACAERLGISARVLFEQAALIGDEQPEEAAALYRQAITLDPSDAWPWNNLGNLLAELGRKEEAESAYRQAISLDPGYAWPWSNLGNLLAHLERKEDAESAYRQAISLEPGNAAPWNNLGALLEGVLERKEEAESVYRQAISLEPGYAQSWFNLARLLDDQDRVDEALVAYQQGTALDKSMDPYRVWRREVLLARKVGQAARQALTVADPAKLSEALAELLAYPDILAEVLVSMYFVEGFLATLLTGNQGGLVLQTMVALGFDKSARPLLLAFEAALAKDAAKLADLEPEVQGAARRMHERLLSGAEHALKPVG